MWKFTRLWIILAGVLSLAAIAHGQTQPFQCIVNAAVPPIIRSEALDQLAGEQTLQCTGGTPTPAGQPLPQFNFTFLLNTNVTSKLTAGSQFIEALLIVDDPASVINPNRPVLNCGNTGAPDSGAPGPGVCSIVSTGNPAASYDGTPNGFGAVACDGAGGRPSPNSYGCGRPNVFQARLGTPQSPGQLNAITFFNVPVDPPGSSTNRTFLISNLRANASALIPIGGGSGTPQSSVLSLVTVSGPVPIAIANPQQYIGYIESGIRSDTSSCSGPSPRLCISEGFANSWRPKNISFAVGNGVPGNTTYSDSFFYWIYNGGTNYPPDVAQNSPGAIYNTETGFAWQNSSPNGPPSPNPPKGIATVPVQPGLGSPLNSIAAGGLNTGISTAGTANSGTRIALKFSGVAPGSSIQVPAQVTFANNSGVMVLTDTDSAGAGPFTPRTGTVTVSNNLAVYEVLWANPFALETASVPYTVTPAATVQVTASFAPFYSDSASKQSGSTYPNPRFVDNSQLCYEQSCLNLWPNQGANTGPVQVTLTNYGTQPLTGAQVVLRGAGLPDIPGTSLTSLATNILSARFDLSSATTGTRDVIVTPTAGSPITLAGGFSVLHSPPCSYSVSHGSFDPSGGTGNFLVTPTPAQCSWSATSTVDWITLLPISPSLPMVQPYSLAPNLSATPRSGFVLIAGQSVYVSQNGASTSSCTYAISPGSKIFDADGGTFTINVTAGSGCAWSAYTSFGSSWLTFPNGSSGSGNGMLAIYASPNTEGFHTAIVAIGGQIFTVSQKAAPCGGTDLSGQVKVTARALLSQWDYRTPFTQQLQLTNNGPPIAGPVYVVLSSVCFGPSPTYCFLTSPHLMVHCQAGDTGEGIPAVLVAPSGLAQGQTLSYDLQFYAPPYQSPAYPGVGFSYPYFVTFSVIGGTPGQ